MDVEGEEPAVAEGEGSAEKEKEKVSTSGPRLTRRESYRSDKKFQIRLTRSQSSFFTPLGIFRSSSGLTASIRNCN